MATRIQSYWRGYRVRQQLKNEMAQVVNKVNSIRGQLTNNRMWEADSDHSIIQIDSQTSLSSKVAVRSSERKVEQDQTPLFMVELEKMRRKLEEQEDRFRVLAEENNELRANLSKISHDKDEKKEDKREEK